MKIAYAYLPRLVLSSFLFVNCFMAQGQTGYEDVVYLKDGGIIRGLVIEQVPNASLKIQTKDRNVFVYKIEEVDKIAKEPTSRLGTLGGQSSMGKGTVLIGASSNIGVSAAIDGGGNSTTLFMGNARVGYFFENNFVLGADIGYSSVGSTDATTLGAFTRYYIQGKIFLGAGFSNISSSANSFSSIPLEIGYVAFITNNVAVEPALGYSIVTEVGGGSVVGLRIGMTLYLNRN